MCAAGVGYFRVEDLKQLLHSLGIGLCARTVKELCTFAADLRRSDRIYYRDLTDSRADGKDDEH